jgi:hypothetical protein
MDRRLHARRIYDIHIRVTDLNSAQLHSGHVADVSRAGLCVILESSLPLGTPLRLEAADSVLYGFVAYATPDGSSVRTGIELQQVLMGETDLSRFFENCLRAFLPELAGLTSPQVFLG